MSMAMLIICLVSGGTSFISFLFNRRKPTKMGQRITYALAIISFLSAVASGVLGYWTSNETGDQLQLVRDQAFDAGVQANRAQGQITEIRTPRLLEPEIMRILVVRLKPYAGQKYDMKVYRDHDSLELARAIQEILEEAGWEYRNVYPKHTTRRYAETRDDGVWIISGKTETNGTSQARMALRRALIESDLYDDSNAFIPMYCTESTGPIQEGTLVTRIPCSDSSIQSMKLVFTVHDDVIPEDTLVLHVGKARL